MNQLDLIRSLHDNLRSPWMDQFFYFMNYIDTTWFFVVVIPLLWFFYKNDFALQFFYGMALSSASNGLLKLFFQVPRPPGVGLIHLTSYSFPSGGAQSAVWIGGLLIAQIGGLRGWASGLLFWALLSFSRVYLGVHYPTDIFAGWIVGAAILLFLLHPNGFRALLTWGESRRVLYTLLGTLLLFFVPKTGWLLSPAFFVLHLVYFRQTRGSTPSTPSYF